jgi:hemerythrin-like domain-containing protein
METKPIKRNEHIVKLSKDHHFTLLFCWKIRNGLKFEVETARMTKYVQYFWQHHMQPHFRDEENIMFSSVQDATVQKALDEHALISQQIEALNVAANATPDELSALSKMVDNHVRYEERVLFPHLERVLTNEQLDSIGKQLNAHQDAELKDDFADEFWLKDKNGL